MKNYLFLRICLLLLHNLCLGWKVFFRSNQIGRENSSLYVLVLNFGIRLNAGNGNEVVLFYSQSSHLNKNPLKKTLALNFQKQI